MKTKFLVLAVLISSLFSCQSTPVKVEYNDSVDFFQFRTFNWLPRSQAQKDYYTVKEQKIQEKVESLLQEKQLTKSDKPDVQVAINVTEKEKVYYYPRHSFGHFYDHWGYSSFYRYEPEYYTEYTIFIALVDPKTKKALWEGSARNWNFEKISDEKLDKLLSAILAKYPPIAENAYQDVK
ncbi:MAG: DUF4136 domain-containing protein [Lentisphaeraceae bacterium]|nr:DUF4136 domain-containing protein [Lentisphaeraceae bacterium]